MADELKRHWFVAAVFREPHDLVPTIAALRESGIGGNRLLVVANHKAEDARKAADESRIGPVPLIAAHGTGPIGADASLKLSPGLHALLEAMDASAAADPTGGAPDSGSQVYAQLRQEVADGAVVLIASVADPDEQLLGARILLRGNCECVLTHEIATPSDTL